MTLPDPVFHWFLPTGGDSTVLTAGSHGVGIGRPEPVREPGPGGAGPGYRPATLEYLSQVARAADDLGFDAVLTPTGAHCQDAWIVTAAMIAQTRRLRFLVAFRPGLTSPVLAAQTAATFQRLSGGRLLLNVVCGGSSTEQRGYGDHADHDQRYARAEEFLSVVKAAWSGRPFTHSGQHYSVDSGHLLDPPVPLPEIYFGGSSAPALDVAARQSDVYLTWGEPPAQVAEKVEAVRDRALAAGRSVRFGVRLHVISRDSSERAWSDAERLISGLGDEVIAQRQRTLRSLESVGQSRMLALHGGRRDRLVVAPNLWAGIGLVRGGAGTALVGSHEQVAERIQEYRQAGIEEFVLSGYPHLEEAYAVAEGVLPLVRRLPEPSPVAPRLGSAASHPERSSL